MSVHTRSKSSPSRYLFDFSLLRAGGSHGGIKPAIFALTDFLSLRSDLEIVVLCERDVFAELSANVQQCCTNLEPIESEVPVAALNHFDLIFSPFGESPQSCPGIPLVVCIADLVHQDFPATLPKEIRERREREFARSLQIADHVVTLSEYSKQRLVQAYQVPSSKTRAIGLPSLTGQTSPLPPLNENHRFLYPANLWTHKNHRGLLAAYRLYLDAPHSPKWRLVLTGSGTESDGPLFPLIQALELEDYVQLSGYLPTASMDTVWRHTGALVFPSLHEGFGIPLVEAMSLRIPIIAHRGTAIVEVVGEVATLVDATNPAELAAAMLELSSHGSLPERLNAGQRRSQAFERNHIFEQWADLFHTASGMPAALTHRGYYVEDGLIEQIGLFALPLSPDEQGIRLKLSPLPAPRTLELYLEGNFIERRKIPPHETIEIRLPHSGPARFLRLQIPDAHPLCDSDPRRHGIILAALSVQQGESVWNLLTHRD